MDSILNAIIDRPIAKGCLAKTDKPMPQKAQQFETLKGTMRLCRAANPKPIQDKDLRTYEMRRNDRRPPKLAIPKKPPLSQTEKRNIEVMRAFNRGEEVTFDVVSQIVNTIEATPANEETHSGPMKNARIVKHDVCRSQQSVPIHTAALNRRVHALGAAAVKHNVPGRHLKSESQLLHNATTCVVPAVTAASSRQKAKGSAVPPRNNTTAVQGHKPNNNKANKCKIVGGIVQPNPSAKLSAPNAMRTAAQHDSISHKPNPKLCAYHPPNHVMKGGRQQPSDEFDDLRDFIDDTPLDEDRWVMELRAVTGYNPAVYRDVDEDEAVESSLNQQVAEERRSSLIAKKEDAKELAMIQAEEMAERRTKKRRVTNT